MRRGTTPRLIFTIDDFDYSLVHRAEITMRQAYKNILIRNLVIEEDYMYLDLSLEDTLLFTPQLGYIQIKFLYPDGHVIATDIKELRIKEILNEVTMS